MTSSSSLNTTAPPPSLSNETLRERILTGGGTGNARGSLTKVASRYAHFVHSLALAHHDDNDENANHASSSAAATALQTELLLHDLEIRKLILSSKASDGNSSRYSSTLSQMQTALATTQSDIESLTSTLANERRVKRHREEYDALAKMGNDQHPPIRTTQKELERVQREIESVEEEVREARWELTARERQMRLFMASLGDLKSTLREEELKEERVVNRSHADASLMKGKKRKHNNVDSGSDYSDHNNDEIGAL
mmetsp:Transcript_4600/g.8243  ORF Transcript_4600/g.8243 Transcript_4600/m.8243 type:complete len:254 (-) Transcript_4600:485-1246(-)|eukprot:CAMPEP_0201658266 /NCGR_PEP_ID=MMETSP0494-20130426/1213_1 /ASSEMBLY_ACC=CAM_ASM_000839 /TAXON_ID=420259 /ORGANISM="Thalassiosira gravida, Strain GMp14c1" /LENGTH=253 /DNA_ID=CAMNT_0048135233 /DNA_START=60 /DNA_END=821 /DNA_ORIENTATION=+